MCEVSTASQGTTNHREQCVKFQQRATCEVSTASWETTNHREQHVKFQQLAERQLTIESNMWSFGEKLANAHHRVINRSKIINAYMPLHKTPTLYYQQVTSTKSPLISWNTTHHVDLNVNCAMLCTHKCRTLSQWNKTTSPYTFSYMSKSEKLQYCYKLYCASYTLNLIIHTSDLCFSNNNGMQTSLLQQKKNQKQLFMLHANNPTQRQASFVLITECHVYADSYCRSCPKICIAA